MSNRPSQQPQSPYVHLIKFMSVMLIGLGTGVVVSTWRHGGGMNFTYGYLLGFGMIAAGFFRILLQRRLDATGGDDGSASGEGDT